MRNLLLVFGGVYASRAYLVGAPAMLLMQNVTGGSRPEEMDHGSKWDPFHDDNGVSGHAFMGAVPFLTLANMYDDNKSCVCCFFCRCMV